MIKVDQTIVDKGKGNCMQAVLASLFEQKFEDTVNVYDYPEGEWVAPFMDWVESIGYEYEGVMNMFVNPASPAIEREQAFRDLATHESTGGYFYGAVNSRTFEGVTHAVIINDNGVVVHDPNPSKAWLGEDLIATKELLYIYLFSKKD